MSDFAEHTISLDDSLAESARLAKLDIEIDARTRELFGTDGSEFGYSREEANARLTRNKGMVASFSRALSEGLSAQQSDDEFNEMLDNSIESIFQASKT